MTLIAKPIVKNQLWVITDGTKKIGNVEATIDGYSVKIGDTSSHFDSTESISEIVKLEFERPQRPATATIPYAIWPTNGKTYNDFYDVKHRFHVYTETPESKCFHVAGYFKIKMSSEWQTVFCPKLIFVQRYPYSGPYKSSDEIPQD